MSYKIDRKTYAQTYGPTTGDRVRLADTELFIEVEKDLTTYGDEVKFGGGKVIRDGMGQSQVTRADGAVDTVITNGMRLDIPAGTAIRFEPGDTTDVKLVSYSGLKNVFGFNSLVNGSLDT